MHETVPAEVEGTTESKPRILIVDDSRDNLQLLSIRLASWGFVTETAGDGQTAIDMVRQNPPDLILLDVMMPGLDGIQVARTIKTDLTLPFIPIIMQTALGNTSNKVEGLDAGADDYITKPIQLAELGARVRSLLRIKALQDALEDRERRLAEANARLLELSRVDALTGLANRGHMEELLYEMFDHSARLNEPLACVLCDIDHFKSVNDTYGHPAGDAVLKQFANVFRKAAREIDRVGRFGGEEFIILLPGTVLDAAVTFAERLRDAVSGTSFTYDDGELRLSVSLGVSAWPHPKVRDAGDLFKSADEALYVAKERGRNRVVRFDSREFNDHTGSSDARDGTKGHNGSADSGHGGRSTWKDRPAGGPNSGTPTGA